LNSSLDDAAVVRCTPTGVARYFFCSGPIFLLVEVTVQ